MTIRVRVLLSLVVVLATIWLASCGHYVCQVTFGGTCSSSGGGGLGTTGGGSTSPTAFAFSGIVNQSGIYGFTFSNAGKSIFATPNYTPPSAPTGGGGQLIVAGGKYLYGSFYCTGCFDQIFGWSIDSTGNLTPISGSPFTLPGWTGGILGSMIANPAGTMLFKADPGAFLGESTVYALQIGAGGVLTVATGSPISIPFSPGGMTTDGNGNFLYVLALASGISPVEIGAYSVGSTGTLSAVQGSPFVYPMSQVAGDSSGNFLIGTTGSVTPDNHLYVFSIQQTGAGAGAISPVLGSPFATFYSPYSIAVQPGHGGNLVYSFSLNNNGTSTPFNPIEGFQLNGSTGALTAISGSPFNNFIASQGQFDQSGAYLFTMGGVTLSAYQVPSGGALASAGSTTQVFSTTVAIADVP
jgi:hypothetical protein